VWSSETRWEEEKSTQKGVPYKEKKGRGLLPGLPEPKLKNIRSERANDLGGEFETQKKRSG